MRAIGAVVLAVTLGACAGASKGAGAGAGAAVSKGAGAGARTGARKSGDADAGYDPEWARELAGKSVESKDAGPVFDSQPAAPPDGWRSVDKGDWSVAIPRGWIDRKTKPPIAFASSVSARTDEVSLGINVISEDFPGDTEAYARANIPMIGRTATVMSANPVTLPGGNVVIVESLWPNGIAPYRTLQLLAAAKGRGYVITCAEADMRFEQARETCVTVLKTFRFRQ